MLSDLIFVLRRIKEVIESHNLPTLYNNLASYIHQAVTVSTPELQTQIKQTKEVIKKTQEELSTEGWSYSQKQVFERFGADIIVGIKGLQKFDAAFNDNSGVPTAVVAELNQQAQAISQLLTNTNNVLTSLGNLGEVEKSEEGRGLIQLVFKDDVSIDNLTELSKQSESWEKILRAYSILADEAPEDTKIVATNKVNPFFLWLSTSPLISKAILATVKPFIDLWHEVLKLQEHALALQEKQITVADKQFDLMKKIEDYEKSKIESILDEVAENYSKEALPVTKKNEGKVNLKKYGPQIYEFIKAHGEVDASQNGESSPVTSNLQLASEYLRVYNLENKVSRMIESTSQEKPASKEKKSQNAKEEKTDSRTENNENIESSTKK